MIRKLVLMVLICFESWACLYADAIEFINNYQSNDLAVVVIDMEELEFFAGQQQYVVPLPGTSEFQDNLRKLVIQAVENEIPVVALFSQTERYQIKEIGLFYPPIVKIIPEIIQRSPFFHAFKKVEIDSFFC